MEGPKSKQGDHISKPQRGNVILLRAFYILVVNLFIGH